MTERGLGRNPYQDPRSRAFGIVDIESGDPRSYTWGTTYQLNQGAEPECVGFSWTQEMGAKPVPILVDHERARATYRAAQGIDREEGRFWEAGASILAGAKAVQRAGHMPEYRWAFGVRQFAVGVSRVGPGVVGVDWTTNMMNVDSNGYIHPTGPVEGGHAILIRGFSVTKQRFLAQNSWGLDWGGKGGAPRGCCWISYDDMGDLLSRQWADACIPIRRQK